jgi:hypothetical protein
MCKRQDTPDHLMISLKDKKKQNKKRLKSQAVVSFMG